MFLLNVHAESMQQKREIPKIDQITVPYLSASLLLNPCIDLSSSGYTESDEIIKLVNDAKKTLPNETCTNKYLVEKLFKARFLQFATINLVNDPWDLDKITLEQNNMISKCKDVKCLEVALDELIAKLLPLYSSLTVSLQEKPFCINPIDLSSDAKITKIVKEQIQSSNMESACNSLASNDDTHNSHTNIIFGVCNVNIGRLFIADCKIDGNQVNTKTWIYLLQPSNSKLLFNSDDGSFYTLDTSCNDMLDLMTIARYNMAEQEIAYYRYDGERYKLAYKYMNLYIGDDMSIAYNIDKKEVYCKVPD